ncbi:hypothetical protein [Jannaschia sp. W003]|uniref:hypothetical protein n=1 Tax=Jannaschia sp. W003 TaxID=2867012 RepID=UPI0021A70F39|nr:hypothetical protein [Jannaschia sp. W003]UWQ23215.1 hypothetical protein K3554_16630 [Jannaschia sp. W003]
MTKTLKITAAALAATLALGTGAQAATSIGKNDAITVTDKLPKTAGVDSQTISFMATEALKLTGAVIGATGSNSGDDLAKLLVNFFIDGVLQAQKDFTPINVFGTVGEGRAGFTPPTFNIASGQTFSFEVFEDSGNVSGNAQVGLSATVATAPVPVPAAGVLMLSLMAAGGFASRRRSRKAANA